MPATRATLIQRFRHRLEQVWRGATPDFVDALVQRAGFSALLFVGSLAISFGLAVVARSIDDPELSLTLLLSAIGVLVLGPWIAITRIVPMMVRALDQRVLRNRAAVLLGAWFLYTLLMAWIGRLVWGLTI